MLIQYLSYFRVAHKRDLSLTRSNYRVLNELNNFYRWTILSPLKIPRAHASLIEVKRRLFLIGGRTAKTRQGVTSLSFVEEYDSGEDSWKRIANMETPRHDAGCVAVGQ